MALFPASPANGATANVNGYQFTFDSTVNAWNRTQSFTGNLAVTTISASGNANVGNLGTVGLITATGNITGGNLIGVFANGTSNVSIPSVNGNVNISAAGNANRFVVTGTGANLTGTLNISGDTTFSGTGQRILGDFSNATPTNRTAFQDKTTNTETVVYALPNGTANLSAFFAWNNSNPTNAAYVGIIGNATAARLTSGVTGSGTPLPLTFEVNGGEAARFDTGRNFMVARTSITASNSNVKGITLLADGRFIAENDYTLGGGTGATFNTFGAGSNAVNNIQFYRNGTAAGLIATSGGGSTSYNASSDYRLKSNPQPLTGSGSFIDALKPKTWTWITNGELGTGFIAHEVAEVAPSTVIGEKDAVNEDGTPNYQCMEYGSAEFIANMIAELQDLRRRFAQLETEVNNLKNS